MCRCEGYDCSSGRQYRHVRGRRARRIGNSNCFVFGAYERNKKRRRRELFNGSRGGLYSRKCAKSSQCGRSAFCAQSRRRGELSDRGQSRYQRRGYKCPAVWDCASASAGSRGSAGRWHDCQRIALTSKGHRRLRSKTAFYRQRRHVRSHHCGHA